MGLAVIVVLVALALGAGFCWAVLAVLDREDRDRVSGPLDHAHDHETTPTAVHR